MPVFLGKLTIKNFIQYVKVGINSQSVDQRSFILPYPARADDSGVVIDQVDDITLFLSLLT